VEKRESIMPEPEKSPLTRLVLFIICIAVIATAFAGVHYYTVDLPQQKTLQVPTNSECSKKDVIDCVVTGSSDVCVQCLNNLMTSKSCRIDEYVIWNVCGT
jgi:hypothetical protein